MRVIHGRTRSDRRERRLLLVKEMVKKKVSGFAGEVKFSFKTVGYDGI